MASMDDDRMGSLLQQVFSDRDGPKRLLEELIGRALDLEVQNHLGAEPHQRTSDRQGYRNGYKPRSLHTRVGRLQLQVPQVRDCEPYQPSLWGRWQRSEQALLIACAEMYFQGVSTRKVQQVLEAMCGGEISSMSVSRAAMELDQKLVGFRGRSLAGVDWPYLQIDARYEHIRVEGQIVSQAVLVVIGFNAHGRREILDWRVGDSESEATWGEVFKGLKERGLKGLKLVTSDGHKGIRAAFTRQFQGVSWQRCRVHFLRELCRKVARKQWKQMREDLKAVFGPEDQEPTEANPGDQETAEQKQCRQRAEQMACKWEGRSPAVGRMLREGLLDCLAVLKEPVRLRKRLRSTNLAESVMKVLKKRSAVVGVFPNRSSCDRLSGAVLVELHEQWLGESEAFLRLEVNRG
jgi:transposase-like protein